MQNVAQQATRLPSVWRAVSSRFGEAINLFGLTHTGIFALFFGQAQFAALIHALIDAVRNMFLLL